MLGLEQTLGADLAQDTYINELSLSLLTKNPEALFMDVQDEMAHAFEEYITFDDKGGAFDSGLLIIYMTDDCAEWLTVPAGKTFENIMTGISTRTFIGLPLCRNKEWIDLNARFAVDVAISKAILDVVPAPLNRLVLLYLISPAIY